MAQNALPNLVGRVSCLVNFVIERDLVLLKRCTQASSAFILLSGTIRVWSIKDQRNNMSAMPSDGLRRTYALH